jgi:hypothetical protein
MTVMRLTSLIAAPLEGMSLWILSWSQHGSKNLTGLSDWLWSLAFVIHIPGNVAMALWGSLNRVYYWPALFISGFVEFWVLIAAVVWGWQTAQRIISTPP